MRGLRLAKNLKFALMGRAPTPRAAGLDSPSVKTTERGGAERGADGGKQVKGRTRQLLGNPLGLVIAVLITGVGLDDGVAAPPLLQPLDPPALPRLETLVADRQEHHHGLHAWLAAPRPAWRIEVKTRPDGANGFPPLEKHWGVERTTAWPGRSRHHSKADERTPVSRAARLDLRHIHLMLRRLMSHRQPACHDRNVAAETLKLGS